MRPSRTDRRPRRPAVGGARTALIVAIQAVLIAGIGVGLGLRDMQRRGERVRLSVATSPTATNPQPPAGDNTPAGGERPAQDDPTPPARGPTERPADPTPPTQPETTRPATTGFVPKTEAELAGKPGHITIDRAQELIAQGAILLDARSAEEYAEGHISGAYLAPLSVFRDGTPPDILSIIPKEHPVVVYCGGGDDCSASEDVMLLLVGEGGFANVHVLHDGYKGWSALGLPTTAGDQP